MKKDGLQIVARISLTSKAQAKPSPEEKIKEWFAQRQWPAEEPVDLPEWHFRAF